MVSGYDISPDTKNKVDRAIDGYYADLDLMEEEIADDEFYVAAQASYDRIAVSPTNTITKTTELVAIKISEKRQRKDLATFRVAAIERGILRAANTTTRIDLAEGLRQDLFENMVEKKPRHLFSRHTKTFQKYRRRAYYYIAEELGLIG